MDATTTHSGDRDLVCVQTSTGWTTAPDAGTGTARWVVVADPQDLADAAGRHGIGPDAVALLAHQGPAWSHPAAGPTTRAWRPHVERAPGGEVLFTVPTLSYVEQTRDVHTGALTCVVGSDVVLMAETGDAHVLEHAAEKLTGRVHVPDHGVHQVLAAVLLTLVATASDVESALGDAVADTEQVVFSSDRHVDPLARIYDLKREIAEARRALGPITTVLPDLLADVEEHADEAGTRPWLRRLEVTTDRVDDHLDGHDRLLGDMLSVHLSQVSVRQNEDMRKISAWAAIAAVPTLVAGIYGMNFQHMPELAWTYGYAAALVLMAGLCVGIYRLFRRSGWL